MTAWSRAKNSVSLLRAPFGERLLSAALFGSRARGDARPDSDLDLVIVLADRRATDYADAARTLDDAGLWRAPQVSLLIWSSSELASHTWLLIDVATDGIIVLDDGQLAQHCATVRERLRAYGARRVHLPNGTWYWDLEPDFRTGDVIGL
jgi:predicted nucleotidyltransferase